MRLSIQFVACGAERIARSEEVWLPDVWWDDVVVVLPRKDSVNISRQLSMAQSYRRWRICSESGPNAGYFGDNVIVISKPIIFASPRWCDK